MGLRRSGSSGRRPDLETTVRAFPLWRLETYSVRSAVSTGLVFYPNIRPDDYPVDAARRDRVSGEAPRPVKGFSSMSGLTAAGSPYCRLHPR